MLGSTSHPCLRPCTCRCMSLPTVSAGQAAPTCPTKNEQSTVIAYSLATNSYISQFICRRQIPHASKDHVFERKKEHENLQLCNGSYELTANSKIRKPCTINDTCMLVGLIPHTCTRYYKTKAKSKWVYRGSSTAIQIAK